MLPILISIDPAPMCPLPRTCTPPSPPAALSKGTSLERATLRAYEEVDKRTLVSEAAIQGHEAWGMGHGGLLNNSMGY
ncbi:unnamed protein product [Closterium sp. NIES-54]